jgi:hypothetical protein
MISRAILYGAGTAVNGLFEETEFMLLFLLLAAPEQLF